MLNKPYQDKFVKFFRTDVLEDELERTPGSVSGIPEAAVSGICGEGRGRETFPAIPTTNLVGGVENWRPQFVARHRKYAEHFAVWGEAPWLLPELKDVGVAEPNLEAKKRYKDLLAKRSFSDNDLDFLLRTKCPGYWIMGHDDEGSRYAKELFCGREWCPICGKKNSAMHNRRFARLLDRATQMEGIGYFVIEWPIASRPKLRTQEALSAAGKLVRKTLRKGQTLEDIVEALLEDATLYGKVCQDLEEGDEVELAWHFERGLSRWHWFGEKSDKYNPHLNVLVDGRYISDSVLEVMKAELRRVFDEPELIVHYSYKKSVAQMVQVLRYITRATFLNAKWDIPMALEIKGFHNQSWWGAGKWNGEPIWSLDDLEGEKEEVKGMDIKAIEALEKGISPKTGGKIHWGPVLPIALLHGGEIEVDTGQYIVKLKLPGMKKRSLGAGYYELESVKLKQSPPIDMEI